MKKVECLSDGFPMRPMAWLEWKSYDYPSFQVLRILGGSLDPYFLFDCFCTGNYCLKYFVSHLGTLPLYA